MSRREADRERDRASHASRAQQTQASNRTNEYFVSKEGIDREVITADICRYLGNDALVRPGSYENPQTRLLQQGYFITAYRNLTTAMIADLKADSDRWDAERRQTASRGQTSNVEYRASTTHQSRQYYGPTEAAPGVGTAGYQTPTSQAQTGFDNGPQYSQPQYASSQGSYGAPMQAYAPVDNYAYIAGADMTVDSRSRQPVQQAVPRGAVQYPNSQSQYAQSPVDDRQTYYSNQTPVSSAQGYPSQQPADPFYGRANTYVDPSSRDYDNRGYPDSAPSYSQAPTSSTSSTTATASSSRRDRERDDPRDRHGHRRR